VDARDVFALAWGCGILAPAARAMAQTESQPATSMEADTVVSSQSGASETPLGAQRLLTPPASTRHPAPLVPPPRVRLMTPRRGVLLLAILAVLAAAVGAMSFLQSLQAAPLLAASGGLEADEVVLAFEAGGRLMGVPISEGQHVQAGTTLAQLDDTLIRLQVRQADPAQRQQLEEQAGRLTLRSPISGVVTRVAAHSGEVAAAGQPIVAVADLSRLRAVVYVRQSELGRVAVGQTATVTTDSWPGRTFGASVTSINERAEYTPRNVQTRRERLNLVFGVKLRIDNRDGALKPGLPIDAIFADRSAGL
jgi:multidrug resistance efflux pump